MVEWLSNLEISILIWINTTTSNSLFDSFFPFYTDLQKISYVITPAILLLFFFFFKKYKRAGVTYFLFLALSVGVSDFIGGKVKNVVLRPRPFTVAELNVTQRSPANPDVSFYSNHASNMFTLATYTSSFFPGGKIFLFLLACLTGYSRMYVGVHYPSDVLVGALMGTLIGWLFSRLARKVVQKLEAIEKDQQS